MTQETDLTNEGNPIEVTPIASPEDIGLASISTAEPSPVEAPVIAQNPKGALVALTEGTPEHETFKQEFHEFLTSVKRDTAEIIAWLKNKL